VVSINTITTSPSLTLTGGVGGIGGAGGAAGIPFGSPSTPSQPGTAGTAGTNGTDGVLSSALTTTEAQAKETAITNLSSSTVKADSSIDNDGGEAITERGFVYDVNPSPDTGDDKEIISGTVGVMSATIESLITNTEYFIRAYAINSVGTAYGEETSFTKQKGFIPRITTGG